MININCSHGASWKACDMCNKSFSSNARVSPFVTDVVESACGSGRYYRISSCSYGVRQSILLESVTQFE